MEMCWTAASACGPASRMSPMWLTSKMPTPVRTAIVLGHDAARGRVFNRHVPAVEFHHLGAHLAMDSVERGLADGWRSRLNCGQ